jgi:hypothetical protein
LTDKIQLCSQASVLIGAGPITKFTGPDAREIAANTLYDPCVKELLGGHRWRFASAAYLLQRNLAAPSTRYEASYPIPPDTLSIHGVFINDTPIDFDRFDNDLHCDALATDAVYAEVTRNVDEAHWPPYFVTAVQLRLAAAFALAVAHDDSLASVFEGKLLRQLSQARLLDSQGRTNRKMPVGRMAAYVGNRP